ncbi:MAG: hypothetical protein K0S65_6623, partial [Labilithrix sp.]|nr:hypothetical protein [Labilithrix sp.]
EDKRVIPFEKHVDARLLIEACDRVVHCTELA